MKSTFKKVVSVLLVLVMVLSLAGCSIATLKAESAVNKGFKALKKLDFEEAEKYINIKSLDLSDLDGSFSGELEQIMRYLLKEMNHKIVSSEEIDEETVSVVVEITTPDLEPVMGELAKELLAYTLGNLLDKPSDEEVAEELEKILDEVVGEADLDTVTREATIKVVKDGDNWKVASEDTLFEALFGNIESILSSALSLF